MIFKSIDIEKELIREREKQAQNSLVEEAYHILNQDVCDEDGFIEKGDHRSIAYDLDRKVKYEIVLDESKIYKERDIMAICVRYRLRFLDSRLFTREIPKEATQSMKALEKDLEVSFKGLNILAPAKAFRLGDRTIDPLLFASLGDDTYYLLHKWGVDMSWYRIVLFYPFRSIKTLLWTSAFLAICFTLLIPFDGFSQLINTAPLYYLAKSYLFVMSFLFVFVASIVVGILTVNDFSAAEWKSRFFN